MLSALPVVSAVPEIFANVPATVELPTKLNIPAPVYTALEPRDNSEPVVSEFAFILSALCVDAVLQFHACAKLVLSIVFVDIAGARDDIRTVVEAVSTSTTSPAALTVRALPFAVVVADADVKLVNLSPDALVVVAVISRRLPGLMVPIPKLPVLVSLILSAGVTDPEGVVDHIILPGIDPAAGTPST
jgi:hypothetical protein